jgi:iron complex outermembrane receptor protein
MNYYNRELGAFMARVLLRRPASLAAVVSFFVFNGGAVQAQPHRGTVEAGGIEEIVVTARQRTETLQDIPLSITAFSADEVRDMGARHLGDIALLSSGVQFDPNMSGTQSGRLNGQIRMRGVAALQPLAHLQTTSLFVDGVYALGGAQVLPLHDLERVEVIKGPQSAFFGRNTFAGAINYITKSPSVDAYEGSIDASAATYSQYDVSAQHTGPIVPGRLGYLATARLYNKGSMLTATDGGDLGEQSSKSASLAVLATPSDDVDVKVRAFYQKDDDGPAAEGFIRGRVTDTCSGTTVQGQALDGSAVTLRPRNFLCGRIPQMGEAGAPLISTNTSLRPQLFSFVRPGFDGEAGNTITLPQARPDFLTQQLINRKFIPGVPTLDGFGMERETLRTSLNANWRFADGYTATLTAGYNDMRANWLVDFDHTDVESWWSTDPQTGKDTSVELRVASPGDERLRWIAGSTYYKQTFITSGAGGLLVTACFATPFTGACGIGPGNVALPAIGGDKARVWAGYGAVSYDILDNLTLDVELRYMEDKRTNTQSVGSTFRALSETYEQTTPRVILTYKPTETTTLYAQASRGTLPGVINGLVAVCSNDAFTVPYTNPVTGQQSTASECAQIAAQSPGGALIPSTKSQYLDAGEVGLKQTFDDGAGRINVSAYAYKWKNLPSPVNITYVRDDDDPALRDRVPKLFANTLAVFTSGSAKFHGGEIEAAYGINDNWDVAANVSYAKNKYTKLVATGTLDAEVLVPAGNTDPRVVQAATNYAGKAQPRYPKWMWNASSTFTDDLGGDWSWFARGDVVYFGKAYSDYFNLSHTPDYFLVHTRAGVAKENLRIEAFVRNLFDEDKWAGALATSDFAVQGDFSFAAQGIVVTPQDKRTFGVRLNYNF